MRLWILSDLHLELSRGWDLPPSSERPDFDVLVVAGDLVPGMEDGVMWLRDRVPDRPIIYVPGNHEFYHRDLDVNLAKARAVAAGTNVHVMENDTAEIGDTLFIGATLWTDFDVFGNAPAAMNAALLRMNDYRRIRKGNYGYRLRPIDTAARHMQSRAFIESSLAKPHEGARVVVTHHGPVRETLPKGHEADIISAAYVSDLSAIVDRHRPDAWIFGHTHESVDLVVGGTRIVSNAKGYGTTPQNPSFDPTFTIEI